MRSKRCTAWRLRQPILLANIILSFLISCHATTQERWPTIHLRTTTIDTSQAERGLHSPSYRRRLLSHHCHTDHPSWGHLAESQQALFSHRVPLDADEQHNLLTHIQSCGVHIAGYLPDHTLLVVGSVDALDAASNHTQIVWAGHHEPEWKIAPEWKGLLKAIDERLAAAKRAAVGKTAAGNATATQQALIAASLSELPLRTTHTVREGGWILLGIKVNFPSSPGPSPHADHQHPLAAHARRSLTEQASCHAGTAASADWAPLLREALGTGDIEVHSAGRAGAVVLVPPHYLRAAIDWLAARPAVHWIEPLPRHSFRNREASSVIQSSKPAPTAALDPSARPFWAAGILGTGQVVGSGDSGVDVNHCYFTDPSVPWPGQIKVVNRVRTFTSDTHRKIAMYHGIADFEDANGHGTHTSGTLVGMPLGKALADSGSDQVGMAPAARLAFLDLSGGGDGDSIMTPWDLDKDYFQITASVGASIHSDSWGSDSIMYDQEAAMIDDYCWRNPEFLPVFPSGNDGANGGSNVNSPATAKNCIAAGATQSTTEISFVTAYKKLTWKATIVVGSWSTSYRVLQSDFSTSISTLVDSSYPLSAASPLAGCSVLDNPSSIAGSVVLIERGTCNFDVKAKFAQDAGAAAVLIFDSQAGAYFVPSSSGGRSDIPVALIPRRQGRNALAILNAGRSANVTFGPADVPDFGFENLAPFSSEGPVGRDRRVKPDLVAPGTVTSAESGSQCGTTTYGGTSMSTPVIAGAALLVREYFMNGFFPSGAANPADSITPSAALIKAVMVAGASSLQGTEADTGLPIDPPPSFRQGFGRIFLGRSLPLQNNPDGPKRVSLIDRVSITPGQNHTYCLSGNGGAMSIALVWTDYPGNPSAEKSLVNDLDLVVRAEGLNGERLVGNGGDAENSNKPDSVNNIEIVDIPVVPTGRVSIEIVGRDIQAFGGPQPYALVINGDFEGSLVAPTTDSTAAGECTVVTAIIASGPEPLTNESTIEFKLSTTTGNTNGVKFQCRMTTPEGAIGTAGTFDWKECLNPAVFTDLPDGTYVFSVRAEGERTEATQSFVKKTTPPAVVVDTADIPAVSSNPTATIKFDSNDTLAVEYQCRVSVADGTTTQGKVTSGSVAVKDIELGTWFNCTSPQTSAWLQPGQWIFDVEGTDAAGNKSPAVSNAWTVSLEANRQYARVLFGPVLRIPKQDITFKVDALQAEANTGAVTQVQGAALECTLVSGEVSAATAGAATWQGCSGSVSFGQRDDGTYTFVARVTGDAGVDPAATSLPTTWAVAKFQVDATPPTVNVTMSPPAVSSSNEVRIEFNLSEEGATAECELKAQDVPENSMSPVPCTSPVALSNLADGRFAFSIVPTDAVGNLGEAVVSQFAIDTSPPTVTDIIAPVAVKDGSVVEISFTADDGPTAATPANLTAQCKISPVTIASTGSNSTEINPESEEYGWKPCTSPVQVQQLVEGHWRFSVQVTDGAGLQSDVVEKDIWVDTVEPKVNVTGAPRASTINPGGDVSFELVDTSKGAADGAGSPIQWQALLETITAEELASYRNGGRSGGGSDSNYAVVSSGTLQRAGTLQQASYSSNNTSTDDNNYGFGTAATTTTTTTTTISDSRDDGAPLGRGAIGKWTNCTSQAKCVFTGLKGGAYTFQARGVDAAGNQGAPSEVYFFEMEGAPSNSMPTWVLASIIAGGVVAAIVLVGIIWCCCRRNTKTLPPPPAYASNGGGFLTGAIAGAHPYDDNTNGYPPPVYYTNGYPVNDGSAPNTNGYHTSTLLQPYAPPFVLHSGVTDGPNGHVHLPEDPIEAQELALALAASEREATEARRARQTADNDAEVRAAIEASLREQRQSTVASAGGTGAAGGTSEDAELRAAIEASLREQRATEAWGGSSTGGGGGGGAGAGDSSLALPEAWPPRRC